MIYPFMTLSDNTEITFGKPIENDTGEHVDVFIETPVSTGFKNAYCLNMRGEMLMDIVTLKFSIFRNSLKVRHI